MSLIVVYLVLSLLCLFPGSAITTSGQGQIMVIKVQGQTTDIQVLETDDDWQCPSMEERERARNKIHQIVDSVITTTFTQLQSTTAVASNYHDHSLNYHYHGLDYHDHSLNCHQHSLNYHFRGLDYHHAVNHKLSNNHVHCDWHIFL